MKVHFRKCSLAVSALMVSACGTPAAGESPGDAGPDSTSMNDAAPLRAVGETCTPQLEFDKRFGQSSIDTLVIELGTPECATGVCLLHYFAGRVSCPYGNGETSMQTSPPSCAPVPSVPGLFTLGGSSSGERCCPELGGGGAPVTRPVAAQCTDRRAEDAVYCSCRCDVPNDPGIDRAKIELCRCAAGFECRSICDGTTGDCALVPKTHWGSYCLKSGPKGSNYNPAWGESGCTTRISP